LLQASGGRTVRARQHRLNQPPANQTRAHLLPVRELKKLVQRVHPALLPMVVEAASPKAHRPEQRLQRAALKAFRLVTPGVQGCGDQRVEFLQDHDEDLDEEGPQQSKELHFQGAQGKADQRSKFFHDEKPLLSVVWRLTLSEARLLVPFLTSP